MPSSVDWARRDRPQPRRRAAAAVRLDEVDHAPVGQLGDRQHGGRVDRLGEVVDSSRRAPASATRRARSASRLRVARSSSMSVAVPIQPSIVPPRGGAAPRGPRASGTRRRAGAVGRRVERLLGRAGDRPGRVEAGPVVGWIWSATGNARPRRSSRCTRASDRSRRQAARRIGEPATTGSARISGSAARRRGWPGRPRPGSSCRGTSRRRDARHRAPTRRASPGRATSGAPGRSA